MSESEPKGLTEEDWERIRRYNEAEFKHDSILRGKEHDPSEVKRFKCALCDEIVEVRHKSNRAYCGDCSGGAWNADDVNLPETKEVECIHCGEWVDSPRLSSNRYCSNKCRANSRSE